MRDRRLHVGVGIALVAVLAVGAAPAHARPLGGMAPISISSVSCPTHDECVVAGGLLPGGGGTVAVGRVDQGLPLLWTASPVSPKPGGNEDLGPAQISCATEDDCLATGHSGPWTSLMQTTDATAAVPHWRTLSVRRDDNPQRSHVLNCPSPSLCLTVTWDGSISATADPFSPTPHWTSLSLDLAQYDKALAASCPSDQRCVILSFDSIWVSDNPGAPAPIWQRKPLGLAFTPGAMSCPSVDMCVVVGGQHTVAFSTDIGDPQPQWSLNRSETPDSSFEPGLLGIACSSTQSCDAFDSDHHVFESSVLPHLIGGPAAPWQILPGGPPADATLYDFDCPNDGLCLFATSRGLWFVPWDRLSGSSIPVTIRRNVVGPTGATVDGTSCNDVTRCTPLRIRRAVVAHHAARFRFGGDRLRRTYQCALVAGNQPITGAHRVLPYKPCTSPTTYRHLTPGGYLFVVKPGGGQSAAVASRAITVRR